MKSELAYLLTHTHRRKVLRLHKETYTKGDLGNNYTCPNIKDMLCLPLYIVNISSSTNKSGGEVVIGSLRAPSKNSPSRTPVFAPMPINIHMAIHNVSKDVLQ